MSAKDKIKKYEEAEQQTADQTPSQELEDKFEKEPPSEPEGDLKALEDKLAQAEAEAKTTYDQLLRAAAEFENYKKRSAREFEDLRKYAAESLIKDLLTVVDNLERAIDSVDPTQQHDACILEGVKMTRQELLKILEKNGVNPIQSLDQPFDPAFHQAVFQEETDEKPENTVLKEMQRGYTIHDRLLRAAMVIVSKAVSSSEPEVEKTGSDTETKHDDA